MYRKKIAKLTDNLLAFRLRVVRAAEKDGVSRTARTFQTSRMTVRKWRDRFRAHGKAGLLDLPRGVVQALKTPPEVAERLCAIKRLRPEWGSRRVVRLLHEEGMDIHRTTLDRIWRRGGAFGKRTRRA